MLKLLRGLRRKPASVDADLPITDVRYVVVDTELTGLDEKKDSIVSMGAVRMTGGNIHIGTTFSRLVKPCTELSAASVVIHEIMPSEVCMKPDIDTVLAEFLDFCGGDVLVGHFLSIDLAFINREAKRTAGRPVSNPAIDTFGVYEWLRKRAVSYDCPSFPQAGYKLYDIAKCFGIEVNGAHQALMDAFITAQLFQQFIPMLVDAGVRHIGELLKIGDPSKGGERFRTAGEITNF